MLSVSKHCSTLNFLNNGQNRAIVRCMPKEIWEPKEHWDNKMWGSAYSGSCQMYVKSSTGTQTYVSILQILSSSQCLCPSLGSCVLFCSGWEWFTNEVSSLSARISFFAYGYKDSHLCFDESFWIPLILFIICVLVLYSPCLCLQGNVHTRSKNPSFDIHTYLFRFISWVATYSYFNFYS